MQSAAFPPFPSEQDESGSVDRRLQEWIGSVHSGIAISLDAPARQTSGKGIGLYLMEVVQCSPHITARPAPLQLNLRYLVTSWAETPQEAHQLLTKLAFAALASRDFEVELDPVPLDAWRAFGLPPTPSFVLRVPLRHARPDASPKRVRQQLQVSSSPMVQLYGVVVGPEDTPIAEANIELTSPRRSAISDRRGRFHFPAVPGGIAKRLVVRAKGRELTLVCEPDYPDKEAPLIIHFTPLEN